MRGSSLPWALLALCANMVLSEGSCSAESGTCADGGGGGVAAGSDSGAGTIAQLTDTDFKDVLGKDVGYLVFFSSKSCGYCKKLQPDYEATAANFAPHASTVRLAKVDGPSFPILTKHFKVKGYPTLFYFPPNRGEPVSFESGRSVRAMTTFLNAQTGLDVATPARNVFPPRVGIEDMTDDFDGAMATLNSGKGFALVQFCAMPTGHCSRFKPEMERLGLWYQSHRQTASGKKRIVVGHVDAEERQDLVSKLKITDFPALVVFTFEGLKVIKSADEATLPPHEIFQLPDQVTSLSALMVAEWVKGRTEQKVTAKIPPPAVETCHGFALDLTDSSFDTAVFGGATEKSFNGDKKVSPNGAMVEFYAPWCGHCQNFAPDYERLAKNFAAAKSPVRIGRVDADAQTGLKDRFSITGFPSIKWFAPGASEPVKYEGGRTVELMTEYINGQTAANGLPAVQTLFQQSYVVNATAATLKGLVEDPTHDVLMFFYAPWCPHCEKAQGQVELAAESLRDIKNFRVVRLDAELYKDAARRYGGTHRYPTVEYFPKGVFDMPQVYQSPPTAPHFVAYVNERMQVDKTICGGIGSDEGVAAPLDTVISTFMSALLLAPGSDEFAEATKHSAALLKSGVERVAEMGFIADNVGPYEKLFTKAVLSKEPAKYFDIEKTRLKRMLAGAGLSRDKMIKFTRRINAVNHCLSFVRAE